MKAFRELDRVLRGEPVVNPQVPVHMPSLVVMNLVLAVVYGCCIGSFGLFGRDAPEYRQVLASAVKLPLMFLLTLGVTFPSLYVFNTLLGTQLRFAVLVRVLTCAMAILTTVMAALGPIVAFFSATTINYSFILLLNVAVLAVSGLFGVSYLIRLLTQPVTRPLEIEGEGWSHVPEQASIGKVFYVWLVVFGMVGAQMSWVLRPFIGSPRVDFTWFRPRDASFFEAVWKTLRLLVHGD